MRDVNVNYHGYIVLSRQFKHLKKVLGRRLYLFYIELALEAYWSRRNRKYFGKIMLTQQDLAKVLEIDQGTVCKNLFALNKRIPNCITVTNRCITLNFYPLFTQEVASQMSLKDYDNAHDLYEDMNIFNEEIQGNYEKRHNTRTQKDPLSINTSSNVSISMTDEDKEWINEQLKEL